MQRTWPSDLYSDQCLGPSGHDALAKRFPKVPIIVDHFARPDVSGGPPYAAAAPLLALAALPNIHLKLTPVTLELLRKAAADAQTFIAKVVAEFGAARIAWGSNWPNSPGTLKEHVAAAKAALASLSETDRDEILGGTAPAALSFLEVPGECTHVNIHIRPAAPSR